MSMSMIMIMNTVMVLVAATGSKLQVAKSSRGAFQNVASTSQMDYHEPMHVVPVCICSHMLQISAWTRNGHNSPSCNVRKCYI